MNFGNALECLKKGMRVTRHGWNGKGLWLELHRPDENSKMTLPYIYLTYPADAKATPGARVPWLASQTDMMAEDWHTIALQFDTKARVDMPVHGLTPDDDAFLSAVAEGIVKARKLYPGNDGRYVAFTGEAGEVMHAWQKLITKRGTIEELGLELRQVAAMACRLAVEGDDSIPPDGFPVTSRVK